MRARRGLHSKKSIGPNGLRHQPLPDQQLDDRPGQALEPRRQGDARGRDRGDGPRQEPGQGPPRVLAAQMSDQVGDAGGQGARIRGDVGDLLQGVEQGANPGGRLPVRGV